MINQNIADDIRHTMLASGASESHAQANLSSAARLTSRAVGTGGDSGGGSADGPKTHVTVLEIPSKEAPYDPARDPIMARVAQLLGEPLDAPPSTGAAAGDK